MPLRGDTTMYNKIFKIESNKENISRNRAVCTLFSVHKLQKKCNLDNSEI